MNYLLGANSTYYLPSPTVFVLSPDSWRTGITNWGDYTQSIPKSPTGAESVSGSLVQAQLVYRHAQSVLDNEIGELKKHYTFYAETLITEFLIGHRGIRYLLRDALPKLKEFFGEDRIFALEISIDEDDSRTLYALAIWQEDARSASGAFGQFVDHWWLDKMSPATADLAFAYKLV